MKAKELKIEIYDPTIFVDFSFDKQDPAQLVGAPECKLEVQLPREMTFAEGKKLSEIPADEKNTTMAWGAQFANKLRGALSLTPASRDCVRRIVSCWSRAFCFLSRR